MPAVFVIDVLGSLRGYPLSNVASLPRLFWPVQASICGIGTLEYPRESCISTNIVSKKPGMKRFGAGSTDAPYHVRFLHLPFVPIAATQTWTAGMQSLRLRSAFLLLWRFRLWNGMIPVVVLEAKDQVSLSLPHRYLAFLTGVVLPHQKGNPRLRACMPTMVAASTVLQLYRLLLLLLQIMFRIKFRIVSRLVSLGFYACTMHARKAYPILTFQVIFPATFSYFFISYSISGQ